MDAFPYSAAHGGEPELCVDAVPLSAIAEAVGTPVYCYSQTAMRERYASFAGAFAALGARICFAVKANANLAVIRTFADAGASADVVSEGEMRRALAAGMTPEGIIFSGVGKSADEMDVALDAGIGQFNVESEPELQLLNMVASSKGLRAPVALRVNPDVAADSHDKVSTGRKHDKFGIPFERTGALYGEAASLPGIEMLGLAVHIGSQIVRLDPFEQAFARIAELVSQLRAEGQTVSRLDLGGGLGIAYDGETPPTPADYAALVARLIGGLDLELAIEPGRALVGPAGVLLTRVLYVKETAKTFVIVDAAMNDLLRPTLYNAHHPVWPIRQPGLEAPAITVDLVGPVCESGDVFAQDRAMALPAAGDLLAIGAAGAYGAVMASSYNGRALVPEVLVSGDRFSVVRTRPDFDAMIAGETFAPWQG